MFANGHFNSCFFGWFQANAASLRSLSRGPKLSSDLLAREIAKAIPLLVGLLVASWGVLASECAVCSEGPCRSGGVLGSIIA